MTGIGTIESKMEHIKTIFQDAKNFATEVNLDALVNYLEGKDSEFRSVAYEGAAMALALKDISTQTNSIPLWNSLLQVSLGQVGNIHVGLGWAIAETKQLNSSFIHSIPPMMQFRVWDGCGYYDGIFRQRQTIKNQVRQDYISELNYKAYDEGIGRSIWYHCKGDVMKVAEMVQNFIPVRQSDLWRGVGIASVFVGGNDEHVFEKLSGLSEKHFVQLAIGAAMVTKARVQTNSITKDTEYACKAWCGLDQHQIAQLSIKAEATSDSLKSLLLVMASEFKNKNGRIPCHVKID